LWPQRTLVAVFSVQGGCDDAAFYGHASQCTARMFYEDYPTPPNNRITFIWEEALARAAGRGCQD
jgi:hypothetical protein